MVFRKFFLTASCGTVSSVSTALCLIDMLLSDMLLMDRECVWREEGSFCVRIVPSSFTSPFGGGVLRCMAAGIRLTPEDLACRSKIDEYVRTWTPRWPEMVNLCDRRLSSVTFTDRLLVVHLKCVCTVARELLLASSRRWSSIEAPSAASAPLTSDARSGGWAPRSPGPPMRSG